MCGWQAKLCDPSLTRAKLSTKRSVTNNKCYTNRLPRLIPLLICTTVHTCHMQDSKQRIQQDNERSTEQSTKPPTMNWPVNKTTHDELTSQQDHPQWTHQSTRLPTMNSPVNKTTHDELTTQHDYPPWTHQSTRPPMMNSPVNKTTHDELTSQQDHPRWTHQSTRPPTMNSPVNKTTHDELTSEWGCLSSREMLSCSFWMEQLSFVMLALSCSTDVRPTSRSERWHTNTNILVSSRLTRQFS